MIKIKSTSRGRGAIYGSEEFDPVGFSSATLWVVSRWKKERRNEWI